LEKDEVKSIPQTKSWESCGGWHGLLAHLE
jgi:hypothetical protein